jgi:hypothetical protein
MQTHWHNLQKSIPVEMLDLLSKLLSGSKKRSIEDVGEDELRIERIRLEQEENKLIKRVEELESQKKQYFVKGKDESSPRQQRIIAGRIKEVDVQARNFDKTLQLLSQQKRVIIGFLSIKENQRQLTELGLSSVISKLDLADLRAYVERATVNGDFQIEKLRDILNALEDREGMAKDIAVDEDIEEIVRMFQETKAAEAENPAATEEALKRLDRVLAPEESEKAK